MGTNGFPDKASELRYETTRSDISLYGDLNGDGNADFTLHLDGLIRLKATDFAL